MLEGYEILLKNGFIILLIVHVYTQAMKFGSFKTRKSCPYWVRSSLNTWQWFQLEQFYFLSNRDGQNLFIYS